MRLSSFYAAPDATAVLDGSAPLPGGEIAASQRPGGEDEARAKERRALEQKKQQDDADGVKWLEGAASGAAAPSPTADAASANGHKAAAEGGEDCNLLDLPSGGEDEDYTRDQRPVGAQTDADFDAPPPTSEGLDHLQKLVGGGGAGGARLHMPARTKRRTRCRINPQHLTRSRVHSANPSQRQSKGGG